MRELLAIAPFVLIPMVEIIDIDGTDKTTVVVNQKCEFIVDKTDVDNNYPKIERIMMKKCFREENFETETP